VSGYWFALALVLVVLVVIVQLLRTRRLREKYATTWIAVGLVTVVLALFPQLLTRLASLVGIATPVNLLFALGGAALLVVCIQYSVEISALEAETRTLAEEVALLRHDLETLAATDLDRPGDPGRPSGATET
jgi:hypothetical protein